LAVVQGSNLRYGGTKSCGCLQREIRIQSHTTHGYARKGKQRPEYVAWLGMKARCHNPENPDYQNYGGRGIVVSDYWLNSFENFLADMGEKPEPKHLYSIDREEVNGNYEPGNCRWVTDQDQSDNQRRNKALAQIAHLERVSGMPIEDLIKSYEKTKTAAVVL